jgi:hypothetical protein
MQVSRLEIYMDQVVFRYRARQLDIQDIRFIQALISRHYKRGRSHISKLLCENWNWIQPNGNFKEYAARDLLLRLEEKGLIELPPRLRPKNNLKEKSFDQIPFFLHEPINGSAGQYDRLHVERVNSQDDYLWNYLVYHHHYLGLPKLVGEHLKHLSTSMARLWLAFPGQVLPGRSKPGTNSSGGRSPQSGKTSTSSPTIPGF